MRRLTVLQTICLCAFVGVEAPIHAQQRSGEAQLLAATPSTTVTAVSATARPLLPAKTLLTTEGESTTAPISLGSGTYAVFHTSQGDFIVTLLTKQAPDTVKNFVQLATGKKRWKHPITQVDTDRPVYNNTTIYRTIENSMICGGDPINKGQGDTGILLNLEVSPDLKFDRPGVLAMDTNGTKSSGSRWFITLRPFPDRTGNYAVFGHVVGGLDVVRGISTRPTKKPQVPLDPVLLSSVEIIQIPDGKKTAATYTTEDGKRVLSVSADLQVAVSEPVINDKTTTQVSDQTTTSAKTTGANGVTTKPL